jgi:hypothetical protein
MNTFLSRFHIVMVVLAASGMASCSSPKAGGSGAKWSDETAFAAPTELTATLADPINIDLRWKNHATKAAGYFVEYSPDNNGEFVIIDAVSPESATYRHPNLMARTKFMFRVVPYFGPASNVVEVTTGKEGPQQSPEGEAAKTMPADLGGEKKSIRSTATFDAGGPTDLKVMLIPPAGIRLDWKDHASDADGYLVEIKQADAPAFSAGIYLEPGTTSLVTYGLPFETTFLFRVRAFFYGKPTNLAEQTTGDDPSVGNATTKSGATQGQ